MATIQGRGGMLKRLDVKTRSLANIHKMDGVVTSVLRTGFFVECGSLQAFVGRSVKFPGIRMYIPVH
jgi:hypothetical protein